MVKDRLKAAMADMAETIRRVFQAPSTVSAELAFRSPGCTQVPPMAVLAVTPASRFEPVLQHERPIPASTVVALSLAWTATVKGEPGWATWATGAIVCELPLLRAGGCQRLAVPALPRRGTVRRMALEPLTARAGRAWDPVPAPLVRGLRQHWLAPKVHGALEQMLTLPVAVVGEDLQKLSKALWMRYTLQLVRSTGQNIRNLEVLGLYLIPVKGTRQVRHDSGTGRLLVTLGPEAASARRAPFILARQKDDHSIVCCFVEGS